MPSDRLLARQPFKGIYTFLNILTNMAKFPFWMLYFLPRSNRQDQRWSLGRALQVRVLKAYLQWAVDVEIAVPWDLTPSVEKEQWVALKPADAKFFTGVAVADKDLPPSTCGATWYPKPLAPGSKPGKVVLHFHGGAFVIGDGRKQDTAFLAETMLKQTASAGISHVFCVQYHLATNPGGRFPAALQDAITSYAYLLFDRGISASDIIVSGDSAGGNLTLSLLRYIADHGKNVGLPAPSCAWLWSPWVNPGGTLDGTSSFDGSINKDKDYLVDGFGKWGAGLYAPSKSSGLTLNSEYINFVQHQFKTEVPLYMSVAENEVLYEDVQRVHAAFSKVSGNKVELAIEPASVHDIILVGKLGGFQKEAADAAQKAAKYYKTL